MKLSIKISLLAILLCVALLTPQKCNADPVTLAILAPYALKGARMASPYAIVALQCMGAQFMKIGSDMLNIFNLPLGLFQVTLGAPFGFAGNGLQNIMSGSSAPLKLIWDTLLLPLCIFGIGGR